MKTSLLLTSLIFAFLFTCAQNQISDSLTVNQTLKQNRFIEDTLWVIDSSKFYSSINNNLQLTGNYKVLSRDKNGNPLTGISRRKIQYYNFQNYYFDSVTYFSTNQVKVKKRLGWNILEQKWMDNKYSLYDNKGRILETYSKNWNVWENVYGDNGTKRLYSYDTAFTKEITDLYLPENNRWIHLKQYFAFKKDTNNVVKTLSQIWDENSEHWVNELKQERHIIDDLNISDLYNYVWDNEQQIWVNYEFHHSVHYEQSGIDSIFVYLWNTQQNVWEKSRLSTIKLNEESKPVYYKQLVVDTSLNNWVNEYKAEFEYYESGFNTVYYRWSTTTNEWNLTWQFINSFTPDSTTHTNQYEKWDTLLQQWTAIFRVVSKFDSRHNETEEAMQEWQAEFESWETRNKAVYFWSAFAPQLVETPTETEVCIYPNPTANLLHVVLSASNITNSIVTIYDMGGRTVLTTTFTNSETMLDISSLKKGVYLLSIRNKNGVVLRKVMKE